jgi:hypothetical protein
MLPARYTQAVMAGESVAGLLSSISRISTKSVVQDKKSSTGLFFTISIVVILACIYTFIKVSTPFSDWKERAKNVSFFFSF